MRKLCLAFLTLLATSLVHAANPPPRTLLLEHVSVVTMLDELVLADQSVLVRNGAIEAVGPAAKITAPSDALRVNARGKFLLPGMTDMHAHFAHGSNIPDADIRDEMLLYVANGVTTVRCPAGSPTHLHIRERTAGGELLGPRIFTAGPIVESRPSFPQLAEGPFFHQLSSPEDAAAEVRRQHAAGYDFIKIYNQIDPDAYQAIVSTAKEIGMPVFGHVPIQPGLDAALANQQASIEHLRGYDLELSADPKSTNVEVRFGGWPKASDAQLDELVEKTVAAGMWNTPTLMVPKAVHLTPAIRSMGVDYPYVPAHLYEGLSESVLTDYYSAELSQLVHDGLPAQCRLIRKLVEAGGAVMAGTDALVPGIAMHGEVRALAECGISNFEAVKAATVTPGRWFARYKPQAPRFGAIEAGKAADLVLYDANPLESLDHLERIAGVVLQGRWLDRQELDQRLEKLRRRNAALLARIKAAQRKPH